VKKACKAVLERRMLSERQSPSACKTSRSVPKAGKSVEGRPGDGGTGQYRQADYPRRFFLNRTKTASSNIEQKGGGEKDQLKEVSSIVRHNRR